jgi:hypothetical protein
MDMAVLWTWPSWSFPLQPIRLCRPASAVSVLSLVGGPAYTTNQPTYRRTLRSMGCSNLMGASL